MGDKARAVQSAQGFRPLESVGSGDSSKQKQGKQAESLPGGSEGFAIHPGEDPASPRITQNIAKGAGCSGWGDHWRRTFMEKGKFKPQGG